MTKDKALKMAHKSFMQLNERHPRRDNGNGYFDEEIQACKDALEQEERTQRTMHCGTADAFIAMDDDHKRRWFVQSLRESKRRKELEDILEQPAQDDIIEEQRNAIKALNMCIGGEDSTTTENLTRIGRLEAEIEKLTQPTQEPIAWMNDIAFSMDKELLGTRSRIVPLYTHPAPAHNDYITISKASYFAMENQIHIIRQDTVKKCADLVMDWESKDLNITAGQRIMGKLYD